MYICSIKIKLLLIQDILWGPAGSLRLFFFCHILSAKMETQITEKRSMMSCVLLAVLFSCGINISYKLILCVHLHMLTWIYFSRAAYIVLKKGKGAYISRN
jgi:hypothetical protein